jgi:hypothetical protein
MRHPKIFVLLTEVGIEEDAETRPSDEKRCKDAPYLGRQLKESLCVKYNVICG